MAYQGWQPMAYQGWQPVAATGHKHNLSIPACFSWCHELHENPNDTQPLICTQSFSWMTGFQMRYPMPACYICTPKNTIPDYTGYIAVPHQMHYIPNRPVHPVQQRSCKHLPGQTTLTKQLGPQSSRICFQSVQSSSLSLELRSLHLGGYCSTAVEG